MAQSLLESVFAICANEDMTYAGIALSPVQEAIHYKLALNTSSSHRLNSVREWAVWRQPTMSQSILD